MYKKRFAETEYSIVPSIVSINESMIKQKIHLILLIASISLMCSFAFSQDICTQSLPPIPQKSASKFLSENMDPLGKIPAKVKWAKVPRTSYYVLSVSRFNDFREGRLFKRKSTSMPLMVYPNVKYFWKVESFAQDGTLMTKTTAKPYSFVASYTGVENSRGLASANNVSLDDSQIKTPPLSPEQFANLPLCQSVTREISSTHESSIQTQMNEPFPEWLQNYKMWMTTEGGMLTFDQVHSDISDIKAKGLLFPSIGLNFQTKDYFDWLSARVFFQQIIGDFSTSSSTITLIDNDFQWLRYGVMGHARVADLELFGYTTSLSVYAGGEKVKTPYFSAVSPTSVVVRDIDLINGTVGARWNFKGTTQWTYLLDLSYSSALSAKSDTLSQSDLGSTFMIDSQIGGIYHHSTGLFGGLAFKNTYRKIDEALTTSNNTQSTGTRKSMYNSFELSAGFTF